jgi:hypothetical protein
MSMRPGATLAVIDRNRIVSMGMHGSSPPVCIDGVVRAQRFGTDPGRAIVLIAGLSAARDDALDYWPAMAPEVVVVMTMKAL